MKYLNYQKIFQLLILDVINRHTSETDLESWSINHDGNHGHIHKFATCNFSAAFNSEDVTMTIAVCEDSYVS